MRTRLSDWQIKNGGGEGTMKYISLEHQSVSHLGFDNVIYEIPFPDNVDGVMIKTIRVDSEQDVPFVVSLLDGSSGPSIYQSVQEQKFHYDQVDIPYKPDERAFYVLIEHEGNLTTKFKIDIRGVEVK